MSDEANDPPRWSSGVDAPRFAAELVRGMERVPAMPPTIRHAPPRPAATRLFGPTVATAVLIGGLVLWVLSPREADRADAPFVAPPSHVRDAGVMEARVMEAEVMEPVLDAGPIEDGSRRDASARDAPDAGRPDAVRPDAVRPDAVREPRREADLDALMDRALAHPDAGRPEAPGLRCDPHGTGVISVVSLPWARIFLDGVDTGLNSPTSFEVSAGTHRIGFQSPIRPEMSTMSVEVCGGTTFRIRHSF